MPAFIDLMFQIAPEATILAFLWIYSARLYKLLSKKLQRMEDKMDKQSREQSKNTRRSEKRMRKDIRRLEKKTHQDIRRIEDKIDKTREQVALLTGSVNELRNWIRGQAAGGNRQATGAEDSEPGNANTEQAAGREQQGPGAEDSERRPAPEA